MRRKTLHQPDYVLMAATFILIVMGLVILFSASAVRGAFIHDSATHFIERQVIYGLIPGLIAIAIFMWMPLQWLKKLALPIFAVTLAAIGAVFIPTLGVTMHGATRWLDIGPITFQPAEFFKFGLVIYLAAFFARRQAKMHSFRDVTLPFLILLGIAGALLMSQPATGTFGIIVLIGFVMYFFAGAKIRDLAIIFLLLVVAFGGLVMMEPYRLERVMTLLNPADDPAGSAFQLQQAKIAIGSGGLDGLGLGQSRQRFFFLPEVIGDSIFAIWAEEAGFIGAMILIALFLLILYRSIKIALEVNDMFLRLLAIGFATWIIGQAFIHIAALTGLLPLTGIPLPFISYGGSALAAALAAMGVLFKVSQYTAKQV